MLACPDRTTLESFLLGQAEDGVSLSITEHLAECPTCCDRAESLPLSDPLIAALHERHDSVPHQPSSDDDPLMQRLRLLATLPVLDEDDKQDSSGRSSDRAISPAKAISVIEEYRRLLSPSQTDDELARIGDRFRILSILGQGGMGVVFLADDLKNQRPVSLKVIKPSLADSARANDRFLNEARALTKFRHDHIIEIYDADKFDGVPYLVMPRLQGETLKDRLRRHRDYSGNVSASVWPGVADAGNAGFSETSLCETERGHHPLTLAESLRIAREIAAGLAEAHRHGILHRDIKPENVFLETRRAEGRESPDDSRQSSDVRGLTPIGSPDFAPRVKLLDFGIARAFGESREAEHRTSLTQTGAIIGTPDYMSPEQAKADKVDCRTDLFSLGCILFEMLTGKSPFHRSNLMRTLLAVQLDPPAALDDLHATTPPNVAAFVLKLLSKDPQKRPDSANAVIATLAHFELQLAQGRLKPARPHRRLQITSLVAVCVLVAFTLWSINSRREPLNVAGSLRESNSDVTDPRQGANAAHGESGLRSSPPLSHDMSGSLVPPDAIDDHSNELGVFATVIEIYGEKSKAVVGKIDYPKDQDWFQFRLPKTHPTQIEVVSLDRSLQPHVRFHWGDNKKLIRQTIGTGTEATISYAGAESGRSYFVHIQGVAGSVGRYTVRVTQPVEFAADRTNHPSSGSNPKDDYPDRQADAHLISLDDTGSASISGSIRSAVDNTDDDDWFKLIPQRSGKLLIAIRTFEATQ